MAKKKLRPSKLFVQILKALSIVPFSFCLPAQAAVTANWNGFTNGSWSTASNWSTNPTVPGLNPVPYDTANINNINNRPININNAESFTLNLLSYDATLGGLTVDVAVNSGGTLTLAGTGFQNNSAAAQQFLIKGQLDFTNNAAYSGGFLAINNLRAVGYAGVVNFNNTSSVASGGLTINNASTVNFNDASSAGPSNIINTGGFLGAAITNFKNTSSASSASITNNDLGQTIFQDSSLAGTSTIALQFGTSVLTFKNSSSAEDATINNTNGTVNFQNTSSAGNTTITNTGTTTINFQGTNNNAGQNATIANSPNGNIDISATTAGVSVGSINETGAGTGGINLGTQTLTIGALNLANSLYNVIQGAGGGLTKVGTNTLNLLADNTYTGVTTISSGTLQLGNGVLTTGSVVGNIVDNAALIFNRPNTLLYGGNISETGTGTVTQAGAGTTILTGTNTYTGGTTITAGTLQLGNGGATGSLVGDILDNTALIFNLSSTSTCPGNISGIGTVTQAGSGTTILTGTNTYTGGTTISAGTLQLGNGGATGSVVGNILDNAALVFNRNVASGYAGVISGTGSVKQSAQTLTFTGDNTYTGITTIDPGAFLKLGNNTTTGSIVGDATLGALGGLIFDRSNSLTYAGNMSGAGGVQQVGSGTTILTGTNTYTGATTISAGTLQLGNGGATGSVVGNIVDNAALIFNRNVATNYGGIISGTGSVRQSGTQTLTFTGDNTYTGMTTIDPGTFLQLGNNTTTGSIVGDATLGALGGLIFNRSNSLTYAGSMNGAGSVQQIGSGTTILTAASGYTGGTTISAGTLQLGNGGFTGSVVGDILDNAALVFNRSGLTNYAGVISGTGSVRKSGGQTLVFTGDNTYTGITTIDPGNFLELGNNTTTGSIVADVALGGGLIVNRSNTYTYDGIISGTGTLSKLGAGTLVLNGTNTFTGDTNINSGNLLLGDVAHPGAAVGGNVIVNAGGQLSGFGTVGGNLTNSGGIVSPGNSIGTITVNGNYTQSAAGSYIVQVDQAGNSDLLNILGTASLNGTVGISAINNGFLPNYAYTILTAAGGVSGTFSNTNIDGIFNQGFLQGVVSYFPNMVQFKVSFNPTLFTESALTPNEKAVADYLLLTGGTPAVQALIASITTADQFRSAMDQISGATYANNDVMITRVGNWFSGEMADRFDAFPSCNCNVSLLPANRRGCDQKNEFWVAGHGAEENIKGGDVSGLNTDTGNFALGYEWAAGSTGKVGVGAGYSTFSSRAQTREMANTSGNLYQVGLYGRNQMGNWLLGAAVDAGVTSDLDTDRRIEGALAVVTTKGSSKAHLYSEQVRLGYDLTPNRPMRFSPFVGVIGQQLNRNSFAENTQTGFELNVDGSTYRSTRSQLGVMLELPTNSAFKPFASVDWEHEFSDVNSTFNANLVGLGGKFHIEGQAIGRNSALVKAGTVIACGRNWNVSALYQGWYGNSWQENGGTLQASVAFG